MHGNSQQSTAVAEKKADPTSERFLELVAMSGNSSGAARAVGFHRNTFYKRALTDPKFREQWDDAQFRSRRVIAEDVLAKALVASGRIVEEPVLDALGDPVLDDDFEPVMVRRLIDGDSRILAKLIDKFVASEDGPPVNNVQVNNLMPEAPPSRPRLVRPDLPVLDATDYQARLAESPQNSSGESQ